MNAIQNFGFEEHLVRVVERDGQPWFAGKDVCGALGIKDHNQALEALDADERGGCSVPTPSGEQTMIIVSEPGVYRLVFRSRKPEAERFKRWLAHDVLPQIRKTGSYGAPAAQATAIEDSQSHALRVVTEARLIYGRAAAARLWDQVGLPPIPPPLPLPEDAEALACLRHLLAAESDAGIVGDVLARALAGDEAADADLRTLGMRIDGEGFVVAHRHPFLLRLFGRTSWRPHYVFLRRLAGARKARVMRWGELASQGVEIPAIWAEDEG